MVQLVLIKPINNMLISDQVIPIKIKIIEKY